MTNRFGLGRDIPEAVKRSVRQRCGFGCAICGTTITEYEHFFPDYAEAEFHDPQQIVLLCPTHHSLVTKGIIPKDQIAAANAHPAATTVGFSKFDHPWFRGIPSLKLGGGPLIQGTPVPLQFHGQSVIEFASPEEGSNIARISANLKTADGDQFLEVINNEWKVRSGDWDFRNVGNRYIFSDHTAAPMLILRMEPPNFIAVEILRTSINGVPIEITEERMMIGSSILSGGSMSNSPIGIAIS